MTAQAKSKPKKDIKHDILSQYMDWVMMHESHPKSVYKFCKEIKVKEQDFYKHFSNLKAVTEHVWVVFLTQTIDLVDAASQDQEFTPREKVLTFYFTLFEILTVNRSYVLFTMNEGAQLKSLWQLQSMYNHFKSYMKGVNHGSTNGKDTFDQLTSRAFDELQWGQFLIVLKFWMDDRSSGFEKTDVMIEKLINTTFDFTDVAPVKRAVDLAKFFIKERIVKL